MAKEDVTSLVLDVRQVGRAAVVRLVGSAGIAEAGRLADTMGELVVRQVPLIVVDLSRTDFICSAGLGAMIDAHVRSRAHGGKVRLVNPTPAVRTLLETTRLTTLFDIYDSVEQATSA